MKLAIKYKFIIYCLIITDQNIYNYNQLVLKMIEVDSE